MNSPTPSQRIKSLVSISNNALSQEREKLESYRKKLDESFEELKNSKMIEGEDYPIKEKAYKKALSEFVMQQTSYREIEKAAFKVEAQLKLRDRFKRGQNSN